MALNQTLLEEAAKISETPIRIQQPRAKIVSISKTSSAKTKSGGKARLGQRTIRSSNSYLNEQDFVDRTLVTEEKDENEEENEDD